MKSYTLNCPNCGSSINLDFDNPQSFCGSCGSKITLDISQMQEYLIEKEHTKLEEEKTKQEIEKSRQAIEKTKQSIEATKQAAHGHTLERVLAFVIVGMFILVWGIWLIIMALRS